VPASFIGAGFIFARGNLGYRPQDVGIWHLTVRSFPVGKASNIYQILEMRNAGLRLSSKLLEDGKYDELPERFKILKKNAEAVMIKG
jgi:hypothetical protein